MIICFIWLYILNKLALVIFFCFHSNLFFDLLQIYIYIYIPSSKKLQQL